MAQVVDCRSVRTKDLDEAREILTRRYCSHSITKEGRDRQLDVRGTFLPLTKTSVNCLQYGADVHVLPEEFETFYLVHLPVSGYAKVRFGDRETIARPALGSIVSPTARVSTRWSADCRQIMLKVDRSAIERYLSNAIMRLLPSLSISRPKSICATA
jgi:hypothetical protein